MTIETWSLAADLAVIASDLSIAARHMVSDYPWTHQEIEKVKQALKRFDAIKSKEVANHGKD